jgi:hypothetical protein
VDRFVHRGYRRDVERTGGSSWFWLRVALVAFVFSWIFGPTELRGAVPLLVVFLIAVGLEVHFLVGAIRGGPVSPPDRRPQEIDRRRYGFEQDLEGDLEADFDDDWLDLEPSSRLAPLRRFAVGLGVIAALAFAIWFVEGRTGWSSIDGDKRAVAVARFSGEASRIAGKPVSVRCDEARDYVGSVQHADGVALVGGDLAILTPEVCADLYRLAFENETTGSRTGRAIAVLAHEAWHLRGERDEGKTECYALQSGVDLGQSLGLSEGRAQQLMRQQLTENALRGAGSLEYRVGRECRDGGLLDLDPASDRFP